MQTEGKTSRVWIAVTFQQTPIHKSLDILKSSTKIECLSQTRLDTYMFSLPCCCAAVCCLPCVRNNCKPLKATKTRGALNVIRRICR